MFQFRAGPNAIAKTSERVDPRAFQPPTNQSALATPGGMLCLIRRDDIKCAVLNPSGIAGVPACDSVQTSPNQQAIRARPSISQKTRERTNKLKGTYDIVGDLLCGQWAEDSEAVPPAARRVAP